MPSVEHSINGNDEDSNSIALTLNLPDGDSSINTSSPQQEDYENNVALNRTHAPRCSTMKHIHIEGIDYVDREYKKLNTSNITSRKTVPDADH